MRATSICHRGSGRGPGERHGRGHSRGGTARRPSTRGEGRSHAQLLELAHRVVVEEAIDALPKRLKKFYKDHRMEMPSQGPEPDFPERGPDRRFQVDRLLPFPFKGLPRSEKALKSKFGEEAEKVGRLPWLVHASYNRLLDAYRAQDKGEILLGSDEMAGFMIDLNGPLNLTRNFDGQDTRASTGSGCVSRRGCHRPWART